MLLLLAIHRSRRCYRYKLRGIDSASKEAWKDSRHFQVRYLAMFALFRHVQPT